MEKITLNIEGMMCGMCESHINDAIRQNFTVKKVTSSYAKKQTIIITDVILEEEKLREAVEATGYEVKKICKEPYEKKGIFAAFRK